LQQPLARQAVKQAQRGLRRKLAQVGYRLVGDKRDERRAVSEARHGAVRGQRPQQRT